MPRDAARAPKRVGERGERESVAGVAREGLPREARSLSKAVLRDRELRGPNERELVAGRIGPGTVQSLTGAWEPGGVARLAGELLVGDAEKCE